MMMLMMLIGRREYRTGMMSVHVARSGKRLMVEFP